FIAPILGLIWTLLQMNEALFQPVKNVLLIGAYVLSFLVVSRNWDMFRRKHFTFGIGAQFLYVAAQTGIFSFYVNYVLENDPGVTRLQASRWLGGIGFACVMAAPFMGHIADLHSMRTGFVVPLVCFVFVALYGLSWARLNRQDSLPLTKV